MSASPQIYRQFVRLYPKAFRDHYGDDLVDHFTDLITQRGHRTAWTRTSIDLAVTIPRYRLESLMTDTHSSTVLNLTIVALAAAGTASVFIGLYPGLLLALAAVVLAITQRSTLARSIRTLDTNRRGRRLRTAAVLGTIFIASFAAYLLLIGDHWTTRETILAIIGNSALVGAIAYLAAGLLTPKSPHQQPATTN
jgi:hypothetical protein